ncbi:MAG: DUF1365 domain-containing protein [Pseudomonadota bacterium]
MPDKIQTATCQAASSEAPASLYFGKVMHARLKPRHHRFNYNIFSLVIDLDRLKEAGSLSKIFSFAKRNLVSFYEEDHGPRDGSGLRAFVDGLLAIQNIQKPEKILLWCNPRVLGYTFNPLSIYFCYDSAGDVSALVYQVHNTFGQSHCYVAPVATNPSQAASIRQDADKRFYVSPFLDMDLSYRFRIAPPSSSLKIRILETDQTGPILSATFSGQRKALKTANLLLGILKTGGLTWKIMAGIHFEAMVLWFKGLSVRPRPAPPEPFSAGREEAKLAPGE